MARIRSIHPTQWTDGEFVSMSPLARLLTIAVRNEADDQGIFEWKPVEFKIRLLPMDNVDIPVLMEEMVQSKQVVSYEVDGVKYGIIRNFAKYQKPKFPKSIYPKPADSGNDVTSSHRSSPKSGKVSSDGDKEEEKKGSLRSPLGARGTRIPLEFSPDAARLSKARDLGFQDEEIREIVREFVSYWSDIPGSRGLRVNWQGTFENRLSEIAGRKKTSNGKYTIRDSIETALQFRRSEEARRSGREGSGQDPPLLSGLRKGSA